MKEVQQITVILPTLGYGEHFGDDYTAAPLDTLTYGSSNRLYS